MKKLSRVLALLLSFVLLAGMFCQLSAAGAPYQTYTYSIEGEVQTSPHAYTPDKSITSYEMNLPGSLNAPRDIFVDEKGNGYIYISDKDEKGNGRVIVCDSNFIYLYTISSFVNEQGVPDNLKSPAGLFIFENLLYVCDTDNARIVIFDTTTREFHSIIDAPNADIMGSDTLFRPVAVGVNASGTTYIVSDQTYSGVIALNPDGSFQAFLGAQKTAVSLAVRIRRMIFPTITTESYISTPYQNLTMDDEGQIWATIIFGTEEEKSLTNAIQTLSTDPTYAPIKRLNAKGDDIMVRNGFAMPAGEIMFSDIKDDSMTKEIGPSKLVDIAMGPNGMWSVVDSKRGKIYTYDLEGNLLFAFGDKGQQLGHLSSPVAITYCGSDIYVLDNVLNAIVVYKRTDYGDVIDTALKNNADRKYSAAYDNWRDILRRNQNFDAAYVGIGKNLYRQGQYEEAMDYYQNASETTNYSIAFQAWRKQATEKSILWIILIAIVLIVILSKAFGYVGRKNKEGIIKVGKRTLWEEFLYGFYVILHPFDGFWDLKHEKRGSVRGGLCILLLTVLAVVYNNIGSAYLFGGGGRVNIVGPMVSVLVLVGLWCLANWCLSTLFDGSLKDIFVATSYALVPIPLIMIPATIATHFCSLAEAEFITLAIGIAYVWTAMLIIFGSMTTHGYSMGRNLAISFFTIVGMVFILFMAVLFWNLITRMISFVTDIVTEISYRTD